MKAHVELWGYETDFRGLIVLMPTNVVFSNQTGGTMCAHPDAEGVYIPLHAWQAGEVPDSLEDFWYRSWEGYKAETVERYLKEMCLDSILEPVPVEDQMLEATASLQGWGEAWIPVRIKTLKEHTYNYESLKDFMGHYAILTYNNSD